MAEGKNNGCIGVILWFATVILIAIILTVLMDRTDADRQRLRELDQRVQQLEAK